MNKGNQTGLGGLPLTIVQAIKSVFSATPQIYEVLLFGSRALGRQRNGSDIDLAFKTQPTQTLTHPDFIQLHVTLDEVVFPYKMDLLDYATISEPALREHIDHFGKLIYNANE